MIRFVMPAVVVAGLVSGPARAADGDWSVMTDVSPDMALRVGDVPAHPASGGFALAVVDGTWHLVPATFVGRVTDTDEHGAPQAVTITATPADALAYLRLPGLVEGKVDTPDMRFKGARHDLVEKAIPMPFKGTAWRFEPKDKRLWFTDGKRRQQIDDLPEPSDQYPAGLGLVWAGDLDRDGKLDFVVQVSGDDGSTTCVWLSSKAAAGQLVGKAACVDRLF